MAASAVGRRAEVRCVRSNRQVRHGRYSRGQGIERPVTLAAIRANPGLIKMDSIQCRPVNDSALRASHDAGGAALAGPLARNSNRIRMPYGSARFFLIGQESEQSQA